MNSAIPKVASTGSLADRGAQLFRTSPFRKTAELRSEHVNERSGVLSRNVFGDTSNVGGFGVSSQISSTLDSVRKMTF